MPIKCELVKKVSKEGKPYVCIEITFTPNYKKIVYLTDAEKELLTFLQK